MVSIIIGMIGLGIMEKPMAKNLLQGGYEVWGSNHGRAPMKELAACGAHPGKRKELAEHCDVIITMLTNGLQFKEVILGVEGIAYPGQILIDASSVIRCRDVGADNTTNT